MQTKNKGILGVISLAASIFTCLIFPSIGLAAPPVTYSYPPVSSRIPVPLVQAIPNPDPTRPFNSRSAYAGQRQWAFADFNGDGRTDIFVAATFAVNGPKLPIEIWLQQPGGTFVNRTSDVIEGPVPITGGGYPLVADFNEDGRPDVFLMDGGLEDKFPTDGETNKLF